MDIVIGRLFTRAMRRNDALIKARIRRTRGAYSKRVATPPVASAIVGARARELAKARSVSATLAQPGFLARVKRALVGDK